MLRADALEVGGRLGGLIQRIPATQQGPDTKALQALMQGITVKFPDEVQARVLAEPDTPYDHIVQMMD